MMNAFKAEGEKQGFNVIESDGQVSSPKQTADIEAALAKGVKGIVLEPERSRRDGAGAAGSGRRQGAGRHRRPPRAVGDGHSRPYRRRQRQGRRGAGQSDRQDVPRTARRSSTCRASPARARRSTATRACTTCSTRPAPNTRSCSSRPAGFDRAKGLSVTEAALAGMSDAAASDRRRQRRHGARRDGGGQGAQPQGHRHHRLRRAAGGAGARSATADSPRRSSSSPPSRCALGVDMLADFLKSGKKPEQQITLLTPVAITKDEPQRGRAPQRGEVSRVCEVMTGARSSGAARLRSRRRLHCQRASRNGHHRRRRAPSSTARGQQPPTVRSSR